MSDLILASAAADEAALLGQCGFTQVVEIFFDDQPNWFAKMLDADDPNYQPQYVRVYACLAVTDQNEPAVDQAILEAAFEAFNIGETGVAVEYRALGLRSLSVSDMVAIDGRTYRCCSVGWERVA